MDLQLANGTDILNPSPEQIREALQALDEFENPFALLNKSHYTYMQASIDFSTQGHVLEYQENSIGRHYQSNDNRIPIESIIQAFQMYAVGDDSWKNQFAWQKKMHF